MLRFLNGDQLAEFVRLRDLALANRRRCAVRRGSALCRARACRRPAAARASGATTRSTSGRICCSWSLGAVAGSSRVAGGAVRTPLADPTHHRRRRRAARRASWPSACDSSRPRRPASSAIAPGSRSISTRRVTLRSRLRIAPGRIAQRRTRPLHRARQHAHAVLQQRAVGRIVHIRFYDRRIDAKSAAVRHPRPLRHVDHLPMQLRDDLRARARRAIFRIVFASGTSPASMRVNARYTKLARTSCSRSS